MSDEDLTDLGIRIRDAVARTTLDAERAIRQAQAAVRTRRRRLRLTTAGVGVLAAAGVAVAVGTGAATHDHGHRARVVVGATPTPTAPPQPSHAVGVDQPPARFFPGSQWSQISGCPSLEGVTVAPTAAQALSAAESLGHGLAADEQHTDRAYWPVLQNSYAVGRPSRPSGQFITAPASAAARADEVTRVCGAETLNASTLVRNCPVGEPCTTRGNSALDEDYLVLLRLGTPLVYYSSP